MASKKDAIIQQGRPRGKDPNRPVVYVSVTMEERIEIEVAAAEDRRTVTDWARNVLLDAARKNS